VTRGGGQRLTLVLPHEPVVGRVPRQKRSLERRDGLPDVLQVYGRSLARKGFGEELGIEGNGTEAPDDLLFPAFQVHLPGCHSEERHQHLVLEAPLSGVDPRQRRCIGHVGETHGASRVQLSRRPESSRARIREGAPLLVAGRAGLRAVTREPRVVEEPPAERDFLRRDGVVPWNARRWKPRRQPPGESRRREKEDPREGEEAEIRGVTSARERSGPRARTSARRAACARPPTSRTPRAPRGRRRPGRCAFSRRTSPWRRRVRRRACGPR
jgi:hypothetical protein